MVAFNERGCAASNARGGGGGKNIQREKKFAVSRRDEGASATAGAGDFLKRRWSRRKICQLKRGAAVRKTQRDEREVGEKPSKHGKKNGAVFELREKGGSLLRLRGKVHRSLLCLQVRKRQFQRERTEEFKKKASEEKS